MTTILRFDTHLRDDRRWVVGLLVSSDCRRVSACLVAAAGRGLDLGPEIIGITTADVPDETAARFGRLSEPHAGSGTPEPTETLATLLAELAEIQSSLINALLAQTGVAPGAILAVGVHDPGLWSLATTHRIGYVGLCDAGRVAERTGLNVIDAFPSRDIASGGLGGPLTALPQWTLLKDPGLNRVLLDLGRTTRLSYLPRDIPGQRGKRILSLEVGPGTRLLDLLTQRLTDREHPFDPGGRFAVQGGCIRELIDHWLADPYFRRPLPRWHPRGVRPERFLLDALRMAVERGWSVRDLLCTATHFIAQTVALALDRLPEGPPVDQIVLTGGGRHNGLLLQQIGQSVAGVAMVPVEELGIEPEALEPACIGILALFYVDQLPASRPEITGAEVSRVLGRLTPGCPQGWQKLLSEMAAGRPAIRPLRSAL
ncbi:MAG: anhydro-N-acetylmuramic acid kinase [Thermoguttaceae bacterium]